MKRFFINSLCFIAVLFIAAGCTIIQKPTYIKSGNMAGLKSYAWLSDSPQITGDVRTDKTSVDSQIRRSIDSELASKGFVKADKDKADFYIDYKLSILTQKDILFNNEVSPATEDVDKGSLAIEAVDPSSKTSLWRGEQKAKVYRYDFVDRRMGFVKNSIRQILSNFP